MNRNQTEIISTKDDYFDLPLNPMRRLIAKRMSTSKTAIPHFYLTMTVNMQAASRFRETWNAAGETTLGYNELIVKAIALALKKFPQINASFQADSIRYYQQIHIGVAVALEEGLVVVVIKDCERKSLFQISKAVKDLANRAQRKALKPTEVKGSTFTISNLGKFEIDNFMAIINQPEAAILAVGAVKSVPVVEERKIQIGRQMKITLSCDHRVIDGAVGAAFLQELKQLLETPSRLTN